MSKDSELAHHFGFRCGMHWYGRMMQNKDPSREQQDYELYRELRDIFDGHSDTRSHCDATFYQRIRDLVGKILAIPGGLERHGFSFFSDDNIEPQSFDCFAHSFFAGAGTALHWCREDKERIEEKQDGLTSDREHEELGL